MALVTDRGDGELHVQALELGLRPLGVLGQEAGQVGELLPDCGSKDDSRAEEPPSLVLVTK